MRSQTPTSNQSVINPNINIQNRNSSTSPQQNKYSQKDLYSLAIKPLMVQGMPPLPQIKPQKTVKLVQKQATFKRGRTQNQSLVSPLNNQNTINNDLMHTLTEEEDNATQTPLNWRNSRQTMTNGEDKQHSTLNSNTLQNNTFDDQYSQSNHDQNEVSRQQMLQQTTMNNDTLNFTLQSSKANNQQSFSNSGRGGIPNIQQEVSFNQNNNNQMGNNQFTQNQQMFNPNLPLQQQVLSVPQNLSQQQLMQLLASQQNQIVQNEQFQQNLNYFQNQQQNIGYGDIIGQNKTQQLQNQQPQQTQQNLSQKHQEIHSKFAEEQKKISQNLVQFGAKNTNNNHEINSQVKQAQQSSEIKNQDQLSQMINDHISIDLQEAIKNLARIDNYTAKYQPHNKKQITMEFDPTDKVQVKKVQKQIEKMQKNLQREFHLTNKANLSSDKRQSIMSSTLSPIKQQKLPLGLEGTGQSNDMLNSISKEKAQQYFSIRKNSNSLSKTQNYRNNSSSANRNISNLHPNQNVFTMQLPELQSKIAQTQSIAQQNQSPAQIRDVNYINVFIQPHHSSLKKIKQERSKSLKQQNQFHDQNTINDQQNEILKNQQEGVVQLYDQASLNQSIENDIEEREEFVNTDFYQNTMHRRSLLFDQAANKKGSSIDLESVINQNLEGQDFMAYIDAILYNSPLFEQMAKQTNQILGKIQTPVESETNSPRNPHDNNNQKNQKLKHSKLNQKPPKSNQNPLNTGQSQVNQIFSQSSKNGMKISNEHSQQRIEANILNSVLDQVLTGKFYYKSSKMYGKMAEEDTKFGKTAKYLHGFDFKQMLLEQSKIKKEQEMGVDRNKEQNIQSLDMLPIDPSVLDNIFSIEKIKNFEQKIRKLLLSTENDDQIVTFLTQELQPDYQLPAAYQNQDSSRKGPSSIETFNTLTLKEQNLKEQVHEQKQIVIQNAHQKNVMIRNIIKSINESNLEIIELQNMKKSQSGGDQQMSNSEDETKRLLYLCFLEMVRQISAKCKEQGLIFIKIWHSYFDQIELQIRNLLDQIRNQTSHLTQNMETLMHQVSRLIEQKEDKELKFVDLKINYEKTQHVLSIATRLLHNEEDRHKAGKDRYEKLKESLVKIFPRYDRYVDDQDFHEQIKEMMAAKGEGIQNLDQKAYNEVNEKIDPYEEDLILDMERISRCLITKTPTAIQNEQLQLKILYMQKEIDENAIIKFNLQVEYNTFQQESKAQISHLQEQNIQKTLRIEELERQVKYLNQQMYYFTEKYVNEKFDQNVQTYISMSEVPKNTVPIGVTKNRKNSNASSMNHNTQKMRQIEATQELIEAFKSKPPLEKIYTPIRNLMKVVREGKSIYIKETKTIKKCLMMIGNIIQGKMVAMDKGNDKYSMMNLDHYYYEYMNNRFGLDSLAKKYSEIYLLSFQKHRESDSRIELFRKFIGLDRDRLPYSIFCYYIRLIKAANFSVPQLFTSNIQNLYIEFNQAKNSLLNMVVDSNQAIVSMVSSQTKRFAKVFSDNKRLSQGVDVQDYQMFKEVIEKISQSKYRNINDFVTPLYQTVPFVSIEKLKEYFITKFDFGSQNATEIKIRLHSMIKTFFVEGLDASNNNIPKDGLMQLVRTKFEMKLPVSAFLHIGMNAVIEHENNENIYLESIYQFYTTVEVDLVQQELGQYIRQSYAINGLSFEQFIYFLNDCESRLPQPQIIDIYRTTCEQHYRILMACDDFIEACLKYRLVYDKTVLESNKLIREQNLRKLQGLSVGPVSRQSQVSDLNGLKLTASVERSQEDTPHMQVSENTKINETQQKEEQKASRVVFGQETTKKTSLALQNIKRQTTTVGKFKSAVTLKDEQNNEQMSQSVVGLVKQDTLKINSLDNVKSKILSKNKVSVIVKKPEEQDIPQEITLQHNVETNIKNEEPRHDTRLNLSQAKSSEPLFLSINNQNIQNSIAIGRPNETFYTQKNHTQLTPQDESKNKKYKMRSTLSKVNLEIISRDEQLLNDPNDDNSLEEIKRNNSSAYKDVQVYLTNKIEGATSSDAIEQNSVFNENMSPQNINSLNLGFQQMQFSLDQQKPNQSRALNFVGHTKNPSDYQIKLEPILEEKYAKTETYSLQKEESQEKSSQKNEELENSRKLVQELSGRNSFEEQVLSDQSKSKLLTSLEQMEQNLYERRAELQMQHPGAIVIRDSEQLLTWNESPLPHHSPSLQKDGMLNKSNKSNDSTLEMVLNRHDSTSPLRSQTQEILNNIRFKQQPSQEIYQNAIQEGAANINLEDRKNSLNPHYLSENKTQLKDFSISEISQFEHSPLGNLRQSTPQIINSGLNIQMVSMGGSKLTQVRKSLESNSKILLSSQTGRESLNYTENSDEETNKDKKSGLNTKLS
eukprot:403333861